MISVALCTYNGEPYITAQLKSILNQTQLVDEIVVCDDGSTDNTLKIVEEISNSAGIPIRIFRNESCLGVGRNFERAISLCKGNIIFLSDQDDIWAKDKVEIIVRWFEKHPSKSAVFTDATLIDSDGHKVMEKTLLDCVGFNKKMRRYFDRGLSLETFFINRATGATMAIRDNVRFPFAQYCDNKKNVLHDYCLALKSLDNNELGYIDQPLIKYRLHGNQQAGIGHQLSHPEIYSNIYRPLCNIPHGFPFQNKSTLYHAQIGHFRARSTIWQAITGIRRYICCYKWRFLFFYLYDIIYKSRLR